MARLLIFVQHPRHVSTDEAELWLRSEIGALDADGVESVALLRLRSPSPRCSDAWGWLVELQCRDDESASAAVKSGPGRDLVADLRLLGMHPSVALVEDDT